LNKYNLMNGVWSASRRACFSAWASAVITCLTGIWTALPAPSEHAAIGFRAARDAFPQIEVAGHSFDVRSERGLRDLIAWLDVCTQEHAAARKQFKMRREEDRRRSPFVDATPAELREFLREPPAELSGRTMRGLKELRARAAQVLDDPSTHEENVRWLFEISAALRNNQRPPAPSKMEIGQPPLMFLDYSYNPIACGDTPAANIRAMGMADPSRVDPPNSSFWKRPENVSGRDLYHGFERAGLPDVGEILWHYSAPKTSYGGCPGFEVINSGRVLKVKFAETRSEPFAARVFWALGFNVDPTDHAPRLKVKYDRRLLREFHLRKPVQTGIYAFWLLRLHTIDLQKRHDPFDSIDHAVLANGVELSPAQLKRLLFVDPLRPHPEDDPRNFRPESEAQIEYLVTVPANIQFRDKSERSIGPWTFDDLGHENLRELRGVGLLGAWIGWFDSRFENNRLRIVRTENGDELRHFFTDLGGGLGKAVGPLSRVCESPNQFGWFFTHPRIVQGPGRMTVPFRISGYEPIEDTLAFERMTWDDARWMARWIGRLSEEQIRAALIASGFDAAHVQIYAEKLISRRDRMIEDLELRSEFPLLRPGGADPQLTFSAGQNHLPSAILPSGEVVSSVPGVSVLENGIVFPAADSRHGRRRQGGVTGGSPKPAR